jgi:hypothetical protein
VCSSDLPLRCRCRRASCADRVVCPGEFRSAGACRLHPRAGRLKLRASASTSSTIFAVCSLLVKRKLVITIMTIGHYHSPVRLIDLNRLNIALEQLSGCGSLWIQAICIHHDVRLKMTHELSALVRSSSSSRLAIRLARSVLSKAFKRTPDM